MFRTVTRSRLAILLLLLLLIASSLTGAGVTQAQCSVRTDWGVYTVVRGDTLYRIALRFNTTVSTLVQGNCLANANRIYVGQQLRVPSGGLPPGGGTSRQFTTGSTFQQYENGFMVWRADNGEIRVYVGALAGDAVSIGDMSVYAARQYAGLPSRALTPPPGRIAPILGFGKVWGNFPTVQQQLGWAISPEQSHTMTVQVNNGVVGGFTIPGGRWVSYYQGNRWTVNRSIPPTLPPPPPPNPTIVPTDCFSPPYKPSTGITVGSTVAAITAVPIMDNPPPRGAQIGTLSGGQGGLVIDGPHCFAVDNSRVRAWRLRIYQFAPNVTEGYVLEYAVDNNGQETGYLSLITSTNIRVESFTAMPNPVPAGEVVTVSWQVVGTQYALLTVLDLASGQPLGIVQELPTVGTTTVPVPAAGISEIRLILHAANLTTNYPVNMYERLAESSLTISVSTAPNPTSLTTQAAFQQYENGFMVWRADTGAIYVFGLGLGVYLQSSYQGLPDNTCDTGVPSGFVCPINGFGRVWGNDVNTRRYMGWATAPEQGYSAVLNLVGGNVVSMTLPDGRTVYIDNGTTWHF
ncbi:MAG: LysM peptidoglycan-binding domain-containing protein [Anaerolineae bacterium]|nr:LysM peptidoglycan-binding domain-containing protein [Anaerolineae bacterium]